MKKLLMSLLFAGSLATVATAQNGTTAPKMQTVHQGKDYIILKDGKAHLVKGGTSTELQNDMTLPNGTIISTTGTVKSSEGTTLQLKEGEKLDLDGKMMMKTDELKKDSI